MKRMTSPASWFGIRSKSNSRRSVSPIPPVPPFSNATASLRSSLRGQRSQGLALSHPPQNQEHSEPPAGVGAEQRPATDSPNYLVPRAYREELVRTYLAWVNAHLKKRDVSDRLVDISTGFQDGITLLNLVEAVSGKGVEGVARRPHTAREREETVGGVLAFLVSEGLDLKSVRAEEIVAGNLKVVLRVVYSLACHYKSTTAPSQQPVECDNNDPHASPALHEYASLKRQVSEFEKKIRDNALIAKYRRLSINSNILSDIDVSLGVETDATACDSDANSDSLEVDIPETSQERGAEPTYVNLSQINTSLGELEGVRNREVNVYSDDPTDTHPCLYSTNMQELDAPLAPDTDTTPNSVLDARNCTPTNEHVSPHFWKEEGANSCYGEVSQSLRELAPIKQQILAVQSVLSSERDEHKSAGSSQGLLSALTSQLAELREKYEDRCRQLSESEQRVRGLSSDLSSVVQECTDLSNRLTESLSIRADVLRKDYLLHNSESENLALRIAAREKQERVKQLDGKLALSQQLVATLEEQVAELKRDKERRLETGSGSRPSLSGLARSPEAPTHLSERVKDVCENLCSLRGRIGEDDTCSHLLDSVEEGLYTIVERLYYYAARCLKKPASKSEGREAQPRPNSRNKSFESPNSRDTLNRSHSSLNSTREGSSGLDPNELIVFDICRTPETRVENIPQRQNTRVLYFLNQTDTPSRVNISKSPSQVTLADVKSQNNKPGRFGYHFKVSDPDFGAVKEEISEDSDFVPVYKKGTVIVYLESHEP